MRFSKTYLSVFAAVLFFASYGYAVTVDKVLAYSQKFYFTTDYDHEISKAIVKDLALSEFLEKKLGEKKETLSEDVSESLSECYARLAVFNNLLGIENVPNYYYQKAYSLSTKNEEVLIDIAIEHWSDGEKEKAKTRIKEYQTLYPEKLSGYKTALRWDFEEKKFNEVSSTAVSLMAKYPNEDDSLYVALFYMLSQAYQGKFKDVQKNKQLLQQLTFKDWPYSLVQFFLEEQTEDQLIAYLDTLPEDKRREQLCEVLYYCGELQTALGKKDSGLVFFKRVLDFKVKPYIEYQLAKKRIEES